LKISLFRLTLPQSTHSTDHSIPAGGEGCQWKVARGGPDKNSGAADCVVNKPGASDTLGTDALAKSKRMAIP